MPTGNHDIDVTWFSSLLKDHPEAAKYQNEFDDLVHEALDVYNHAKRSHDLEEELNTLRSNLEELKAPPESTPAPFAWFDDLVKEHSGAEKYRYKMINTHRQFISALASLHEKIDSAPQLLRESTRKFLIDMTTAMTDKAATYTTTVLSIGYVGLFAAWSQSTPIIPAPYSRLIIVCGLISLSVFVLFEIAKMVWNHVNTMKVIGVIKQQGLAFDEAHYKYTSFAPTVTIVHQWIWSICLMLALLFGFAAAAILVYAHVERAFSLV